jgi:uncharacterized coiled-coil DUF342 family protein
LEVSFSTSLSIILFLILIFITALLAYLLTERSKEADTYRNKANQFQGEAANFLNDSKLNKELAAQYQEEIIRARETIEKLKGELEECQEIILQYKGEANKYYMEADALRSRLETLKTYETIENTALWVEETTKQMQNYMDEVQKYANTLIDQAQQQARSIVGDKIVA